MGGGERRDMYDLGCTGSSSCQGFGQVDCCLRTFSISGNHIKWFQY